MEDGVIKGKNYVRMGHGRQFLKSADYCNYFGIEPDDCRCCGILVVCQQN